MGSDYIEQDGFGIDTTGLNPNLLFDQLADIG